MLSRMMRVEDSRVIYRLLSAKIKTFLSWVTALQRGPDRHRWEETSHTNSPPPAFPAQPGISRPGQPGWAIGKGLRLRTKPTLLRSGRT